MDIDFKNEIRYNLAIFNTILRKKNVTTKDTEQLIILINNIAELLDIYLYDYLNY